MERNAQALAEYEAKMAKRQAKRDAGKKPGGKDPDIKQALTVPWLQAFRPGRNLLRLIRSMDERLARFTGGMGSENLFS